MNNTPTISVIIPVYGVEDYIEKCLQSLLDQTFTDFEAIIVDDGSLDQSIPKAKKLVDDDPRFIFLEKENGGQGSARNMGLDYSRGNYIAFLDSDDYLHPQFLEKTYHKIKESNAEICLCDSYKIQNGEIIDKITNNPRLYKELDDFLLYQNTVTSFMWDKLFLKSVFKDMRFNESIRTYEDSHFVFKLIYHRLMTHVSEPLYYYVQHNKSTTNSYNPTYIEDRTSVIKEFQTFTKKHYDIKKTNNYFINCYLQVYVYTTLIGIVKFSPNCQKDLKKLKRNLDKNFFNLRNILNYINTSKKMAIALLIFKLSPFLFEKAYNAWKKIQ